MTQSSKIRFLFFVLAIFVARLLFGLVSEFWFEDELQVYLIGLKSYTTGTWPYYGPDVVYTNTQIPGALQGLLVAIALFIAPFPESPTILLNILSFGSLAFFAWYITKRITKLPAYLIWIWIMTLPWTINYSTRVVNPSYVLVFAIPFFISVFELLPIYRQSILPTKLCFFLLGICPFLVMQLHMSYVIMFYFVALVFLLNFTKPSLVGRPAVNISVWLIGALTGSATLIPTLLKNEKIPGVSSNIVFNIDNYKTIVPTLRRYLSFAIYEIPYFIGSDTEKRIEFLKSTLWALPFVIYLMLFGSFLILVFIASYFRKNTDETFTKIKHVTLLGYILVFVSFFFSIKGPSSHTFYLILPIPVFYSFYCYEWLWQRYKWWRPLMYAAIVSCVFFYPGLGYYNYLHKSLYKDRERVAKAIEKNDYKILGMRRADLWGYGY